MCARSVIYVRQRCCCVLCICAAPFPPPSTQHWSLHWPQAIYDNADVDKDGSLDEAEFVRFLTSDSKYKVLKFSADDAKKAYKVCHFFRHYAPTAVWSSAACRARVSVGI